jgi:hypothetical protein
LNSIIIDKLSGDIIVGKEIPVLDGEKMTELKIYDEDYKNMTSYKYIYVGNDISETQTLDNEGVVINSILNELVNGILLSQTEKDGKGSVTAIKNFKQNENNDINEYLN